MEQEIKGKIEVSGAANGFFGARVMLAPMAGVTDLAFRTVCREAGAEYTCTEMVSAKALTYGDKKSRQLLKRADGEHPCAAQIFGSEPDVMREGAKIAAEVSGADVIDINMGCPMGKIVNNREGSALMRDLDLAARVIEAVVEGSPVPVTVKIRKGWDSGSVNCVEVAKLAESLGVAAVCVHGRTRSQLYSGLSDRDAARDVKRAVKIPVIANGDVFSGSDAVKLLRYTGADAVMIGRGSFGRPWIFAEVLAALGGGEPPKEPSVEEKCAIAVRQFELAREDKGERIACLEARRHYSWYLKGIPYAGYYREKISHITTFDDIYEITRGICRDLK